MLKWLSEQNRHVEYNKYVLFFDKVQFLGHITTQDVVSVVYVRVSAVCNWLVSKTAQDIQSFLGIVNFCRWFIRSFEKISELLTSLTKKDHVLKWTEVC